MEAVAWRSAFGTRVHIWIDDMGDTLVESAQRPASAGIVAVLDVLEVMSRVQSASLARLARETGFAKSTLHRTCGVMVGRGWLSRDPVSGEFGLGPRASALRRPPIAVTLADAFPATAERLVARHNETTCLAVLSGGESLFLAKLETTHPVRLMTRVGGRVPAFASASGRVLLADLDPSVVDGLYAEDDLITPTGRRLGGLVELHRILQACRRHGYAQNIDETALGLHCIAVPVGPPSAVAAAITFCVPSGRMTEARERGLLPGLRAAARDLWAAAVPVGEETAALRTSSVGR